MTLQAGDQRFVRSAVMTDNPNGGGPPSAQVIPDGSSNAIFPDISEDARTGGKVEIRHVHGVLRNLDTDPLLGANIIIAEPSDDPNVSLTLVDSGSTFARRPDIVKLVEASSTPGSEFAGFLRDDHEEGMRSIYIAQRPGLDAPAINTQLVLVLNEGLTTEVSQFVRVRRVTVRQETFTEGGSGGYVDYPIQVAECELFNPLKADFKGTTANRLYAKGANKTIVRRVNMTDAGTFYGASRLKQPTLASDLDVFVQTVFTQLVPNTKTETPLTDQRPGGTRAVTLTDSIGTLDVTAASHTQRIMITQATQGWAYTFALKPTPAPGSITVSYVKLGNWYTIMDDGAGAFTGQGFGTVNYNTGSVGVTLQEMPDFNTPVLISWADTAPYTNVCANGPITLSVQGGASTQRGPQFQLAIQPGAVVNGISIQWLSGGAAQTATVAADGTLSGAATGRCVPALGVIYIKPNAMPDAGTSFTVTYPAREAVMQSFSSVGVDGAGFAYLTLDDEPIPGSINVRWYSFQKVSDTSGASLSQSNGTKTASGSTNTNYSIETQNATNNTAVMLHQLSDDGSGGFGDTMGTANYAGKALSIRMVTIGGTTSSYKTDHEDAKTFEQASTALHTDV